jgi:electron transport protein HydN
MSLSIHLNSFVLADPKKCIGCKVCEVACAVAHRSEEIKTVGNMDIPVMPRLYLVRTADVTMPIQCRHCEDAPCANICPVSAITQVDNKIIINEECCIGCKTCMIACPFGAIELAATYKEGKPVLQNLLILDSEEEVTHKQSVVASKCDLCIERPNGPACIEACPRQALIQVNVKMEKKRRNADTASKTGATIKNFMV